MGNLNRYLRGLGFDDVYALLLQPTLSPWGLWNDNPIINDPRLAVIGCFVLNIYSHELLQDNTEAYRALRTIRDKGQSCKRLTRTETRRACASEVPDILALLKTLPEEDEIGPLTHAYNVKIKWLFQK